MAMVEVHQWRLTCFHRLRQAGAGCQLVLLTPPVPDFESALEEAREADWLHLEPGHIEYPEGADLCPSCARHPRQALEG